MKKKRFQHSICFSSVEDMPEAKGSVAFITDSAKVFKDDIDIAPITLTDGTQYVPWGGDNMMPYNILSMIEKDETLATCQMFNAEVCYGSGLVYNTDGCSSSVKEEVEDFLLTNSLPSYFLGVCQDFKHFGWCVSVIILDNEGKRIVRLYRKEVCYCRFSPAKSDGRIEYVLYANWNKSLASINEVEKIPLLSFDNPWGDLQQRMQKKSSGRKFAVVWHPSRRWRRFRCFRSTTLGAICSSGCRRSRLPGSSRWSAVCRHRTARIILSLIMLLSSRGIGTTSSSLSGWRRRRS